MIFSKSFGYAVRSILYIALEHENKQVIQSEEIAGILHIPRHFASKILKNLVKHDFIASVKGPSGGFAVNSKTLEITLMNIYAITDDVQTFSNCALRFNECNNENPCPLHNQMLIIRDELKQLLTSNTIRGLLKDERKDILKSIITTNNIQTILNP